LVGARRRFFQPSQRFKKWTLRIRGIGAETFSKLFIARAASIVLTPPRPANQSRRRMKIKVAGENIGLHLSRTGRLNIRDALVPGNRFSPAKLYLNASGPRRQAGGSQSFAERDFATSNSLIFSSSNFPYGDLSVVCGVRRQKWVNP
jgi:hypothetical protein